MKDKHDGYFVGHTCSVPKEKLAETQHKIACGPLMQMILKVTTVNLNDNRARKLYRSFAALHAEKYRQYEHHSFGIHPYSKLRFCLEATISFVMIFYMIILAVNYSRRNPEAPGTLLDLTNWLEAVYFMDLVFNFLTGYIDGYTNRYVVLDLKKIFCRNLLTWFPLDLLCCASCILKLSGKITSVANELYFVSLKVFSLPIIYIYIKNCLNSMKTGIVVVTVIEISLFLLLFISVNIYFQFATEYITENSFNPATPHRCSWLKTLKMWNGSSDDRFFFGLDRSVGMLRSSVYTLPMFLTKSECPKHLKNVSWLIGQILTVHCTLKYAVALLGSDSAKAKYYLMTLQIKCYMDVMKYPSEIKKRMLKLYDIRYQSHFSVESRMMDCVTGQLREEIVMYTGRQLVNNVPFLKQLPRSTLHQIGIKLQVFTYIAGDVIYKIHSFQECMYFVHKGTVAIYGEIGRELVHCEDGDFFGEAILALEFKSQPETAVAVTNCELFRLDKEDFDNTIACDPIAYEELKKIATNKIERFNVINEKHRNLLNSEDAGNDRTDLV